MGKKARKTRWKALSIDEPRSNCTSPVFDSSKSYSSKARLNGAQAGPGAHQKYNSSHSTPTRPHRGPWAPHKDQSTSTRSNSTCSDTKITFNEDEYTKITTPRQDVLFKKGYLSKPKPYLQRPLTSAGTSTGDGTPDHQSADGADFPESDLDGFTYPPTVDVFNPSLCYVNYDSQAPMILYDNFGNSVVYYPPPAAGLPHYEYQPTGPENTKKRYSIDSVSQNTTPNNETNENYESVSEPEVFEGARHFPDDHYTSPEENPPDQHENPPDQPENPPEKCENPPENSPGKSENPAENSPGKSENPPENSPGKSENPAENSPGKSENPPENSPGKSENPPENSPEFCAPPDSGKYKYRVDAEEFVPRGFVPNFNYMPICPEFFGGHFVILPPSLPPFSNFYPVPTVEPTEQQMELDVHEEVVQQSGQGIDIQKIVSKLEQAAQEQNLRASEETIEDSGGENGGEKQNGGAETEKTEEIVAVAENTTEPDNPVQIQEVINEKSLEPASKPEISSEPVIKYSDRLKSASTATNKPKPVTRAPRVPRTLNQPAVSAATTHKTCPRLYRQSSKNSTTSGHEKIQVKSTNAHKNTPEAETRPQKNDLNNRDVVSGGAKQPEVPSSDSWVSVNSRKKRKNPKNKTNEVLSDSDQNIDPVGNLTHPEVIPTPQTPVDVAPIEPEVETPVKMAATSGSIKKSPKENKNKNSAPKKVKKRVLITDECLGTLNCHQEAVGKPETIEEPKLLKPEPVQQCADPVLQTSEPKKPKKKRSKPKTDIICTIPDPETNLSTSLESLGLLDASGHSTVPVDVSEVELELEKMIQRGLYANLEQKLGKSDSFLGNLNSLFSPPKIPKVFPQIRVPITSVEAAKVTKPSPEPEMPPTTSSNKLSVTEAVKKWIDKTRETTPEVEIFRKPEDIREGMLSQVLNIEEEEELEDSEVAEVAKDASCLIDNHRSRSASIDIMEYWDDDINSVGPGAPEGPLPALEAAQDALETIEVYESVYGISNDFERVQSDSSNGNSTRGRLFGRLNRNNSLPYRAICCSVM